MGIVGLRLLPSERCGKAKADWSPGKRVCAKRGRVPVGVLIGTQRARSSPVGFRPDPAQYVDEVGHWLILSASQRLDPVDEHHRCLVGRHAVRRLRCMDRSVERQVNTSREPGQLRLKYHLSVNIQCKTGLIPVTVW